MYIRLLIVPIILLIIAGLLLFGIIYNSIRLIRHKAKRRHIIGLAVSVSIALVITYGFTLGFEAFKVQHVEFESADLPASFHDYKIVMFTDAHVGNFVGRRQWMVRRAVDSINAQHPDAIVFCGDIENTDPAELKPFAGVLSSLRARDGVFSVLGNHDYSLYKHDISQETMRKLNEQTIQAERSFGWHLLMNETAIIRRGGDSIVIAGEENGGHKPFPCYADAAKTMAGINDSSFVVMLQHDPSAWRRQVLPQTNAQLTLSGHTHAGQVSIFGWSPTSLIYEENCGAYHQGDRMLYVSSGLGGIVPFRIDFPGEIVVITLKKK